MEVKKETVVSVFDSLGLEMKCGDKYIFETSDACFAGTYKGLSKRGALMFDSVIADSKVTMNILPKSVVKIVPVEISIKESEDK